MIELHEGEKSSTKVWRFPTGREYTKDEVEAEVTSLFPHIIKKGLRLNFFYHDDLAGRVHIESDGDMQAALQCFVDEWDNEEEGVFDLACRTTASQSKQRALVLVVVQLMHLNSLQRIER